jgi:hypothetical protein
MRYSILDPFEQILCEVVRIFLNAKTGSSVGPTYVCEETGLLRLPTFFLKWAASGLAHPDPLVIP